MLITNDTRAALQMRGWFKLFANQPYLETYISVDKFDEKYGQPIKVIDQMIGDTPIEDDSDSVSQARKLEVEAETTPIRLIIFDLDAVTSKPLDWIVATVTKLKELGHVVESVPLRTMILGYDDPNLRPDRFRHEAVNDMVLKPLDQQLFLQKVELLLADKPDAPPSFLFRASAEGSVEIGKDATIDELSDFAISIRNPGPLADGVFAQIHSTVFGSGLASSRVVGRAFASVRHPQFEGMWLVRFALFGISNAQLAELRKFIRTKQVPGRARVSAPPRKTRGKEKLPPRFRIAVIDLDRDVLAQAAGTIEENFDRTAVTVFPSYTRLLGELVKLSGNVEAVANLEDDAGTVSESGIPLGRIALNVDEKNLDLLSFDPKPPSNEQFLARPIQDWLERPRAWFDAIPKSDTEDFNEFLNYTVIGGKGVTGVRFVDNIGNFVYAEVKGHHVRSADPEVPPTLRLELKQIDRTAWIELNRLTNKAATPDMFRFDAIFIDGGLIRSDIQTWLDGFHQTLVRARVIAATDSLPKVFVLADEGSRVEPGLFAHRGVSDFIYKPIDRKLVTDKLSAALPALSRTTPLDASPFVPCEITAQVCKAIDLEELSEFGLTVRHPTPFKPHIFMRFFSPLFGETADGVLARCASSIPVTNISAGPKKDQESAFNCQFVFFGCSDELHKRIRNWIREDYVHKKEGSV